MPPVNAASVEESARWYRDEVEPHQSSLRRWLRARFPWLSDVDNVAQEAVVRLWRRRQRPDAAPIQAPKAALYAIARNAAFDQSRRTAVARIDAIGEMERLQVLSDEDVVQNVAARQEFELLTEAIRLLPERCRQVITLTKVYGLTEPEVAERLGIAESTVRTQVLRGMERLDDFLRVRGVRRGRR